MVEVNVPSKNKYQCGSENREGDKVVVETSMFHIQHQHHLHLNLGSSYADDLLRKMYFVNLSLNTLMLDDI